MYDDIKKQERTKNYFLDAIKGASNPEESNYFSQGLNLIGVYFETPYLINSQVLAEPYLDINLEDEVGLTVEVTLKPEDKEGTELSILDKILERTRMGTLHESNTMSDEDQEQLNRIRAMSDYIVPKEMAEDSNNREVTLHFSEDSVSFQKFKMVDDNYYLFTLEETGLIGKEDYEHSLYILFKDKNSSYETFFSNFVGEDLNLSVTKRILESISQTNITGMFLGGASTLSKVLRTTSIAISTTDINIDEDEEVYITTVDSTIQFSLDDIKNSEVKNTSAGKYTLIIYLKDSTDIYIYLG